MRSVPTALNTELLKDANFLANLVEMQLSSTIYFTNLDIDVVYDGHTWLSRGLTFSGAEYSISPQIDKISFEIDNVGLEFSAFVLGQETRGKKCIISLAAMTDKNELLTNGGLETAGTGTAFANWTEDVSGTSTINRDTAVPYRGAASCRFDIDAGANYAWARGAATLVPGGRYRLTFWHRTSSGNSTAQRAYLGTTDSVHYLQPDGTWGAYAPLTALQGSGVWKQYSIDFTAHADHGAYYLYLFAGTNGADTYDAGKSVWFDDASIMPLFAPPATVLSVNTIFSGILDAIKLNHQRAVFDVYNPLIFWKRRVPRRIHQPSCPWPFKGSLCTYAGAEVWCDQSYARCAALSNSANFGGFRFLPDLQDKQIWWGRAPR